MINGRYYGGCEFVNVAEQLAIDRVKRLFGAEYAMQILADQLIDNIEAFVAGRSQNVVTEML